MLLVRLRFQSLTDGDLQPNLSLGLDGYGTAHTLQAVSSLCAVSPRDCSTNGRPPFWVP